MDCSRGDRYWLIRGRRSSRIFHKVHSSILVVNISIDLREFDRMPSDRRESLRRWLPTEQDSSIFAHLCPLVKGTWRFLTQSPTSTWFPRANGGQILSKLRPIGPHQGPRRFTRQEPPPWSPTFHLLHRSPTFHLPSTLSVRRALAQSLFPFPSSFFSFSSSLTSGFSCLLLPCALRASSAARPLLRRECVSESRGGGEHACVRACVWERIAECGTA